MPRRDQVTAWLAVLVWGGVIVLLSTEHFGGDETGAFLLPLLGALFPSASPAELAALHQAIRKLAHFVEYFVLGLLLHRALRVPGARRLRTAALAVVLAAAWATVDEASQAFADGRGPSVVDVLLDVSGAAAAQMVLAVRRPTRFARAAVPPTVVR